MIIGIMGLAGSGKTAAAGTLHRAYGYPLISVAAPIKAMLNALGITPEQMQAKLKDRPMGWLGNKSPRDLMQSLGQWGRDQSATMWSGLLEARLQGMTDAVVDDIRMPLEANAIHQRGGYLIRITRPGLSMGRDQTERQGQHIECDHTILNNGGLMDLEHQVLSWAEDYVGPIKTKAKRRA